MKDAQHQQLEMKEDLEEAFGKELESWLRFIASNYPIIGTFLPEVLVVITHRDRMKMHKMEKSCDWAERKGKQYQIIYEKHLKLYEGFFYVDAQDVEGDTTLLSYAAKEVSAGTVSLLQLDFRDF
ncbi:hypothetical protein R1flu_003381 [Riccia fluitans]|uniref:Uncharacterized protein n=1 Tax=Riccia fluitans TaxID=41844 RepID=A0ABD1Y980_9MARC